MLTSNQFQISGNRCGGIAVAAGLLACVPSTYAALLVQPETGIFTTTTTSASPVPADKDEGLFSAMYAPFGSFFGSALSGTPTISTNGHLYWGAGNSNDSHVQFLGTNSMTRIAPMWGDFKLGTGSRIIQAMAENYFAVTWENIESVDSPGTVATFQAIFFEFADTVQGNSFSPGDIVFSYGNLGAYQAMNEVIVGLESGTSFATLPGTMAGWNSYGVTGNIPVGAGEFARFRPDGAGNYTVSVLPIPEPTSAALGFAGGLLMLRRRRAC
ncbi:MAG: hypothetical protein EOP88_06675 [Verrucomicrobiaceae bacterium]|nr:MAG: hypothetical protein EOP88_06675 [Verrucomicrobiaceae bacterium]